jgi:hypothetical protein
MKFCNKIYIEKKISHIGLNAHFSVIFVSLEIIKEKEMYAVIS